MGGYFVFCFVEQPSTIVWYTIYGLRVNRWGVILYFHTHPNQVVVLYFGFLSPSSEVGVPQEGGGGSLVCGVGVVALADGGGLREALGRSEGSMMEGGAEGLNQQLRGKGAGSELFRTKAGGFGGERGWSPPRNGRTKTDGRPYGLFEPLTPRLPKRTPFPTAYEKKGKLFFLPLSPF